MTIIPGTSGDDFLDGGVDSDEISGLAGNDTILGNDGNDTLNGGNGNDFLAGGAGDDTIRPGSGDDHIEVGMGDDLILLDDKVNGEGFLSIQAHGGALGIFAMIDGDANFGEIVINNGPLDPESLASLEGLNNALQLDYSKPEGGMAIIGTDYGDEFLIDAGETGWIMVRPGEGEDIIHIEGQSGTVRLDYSDQVDSIFANLRFGIVVDGSDGFVRDRIIGNGHVQELRATDFDDDIFGSNEDERFILRAGDDFLDARGGNDTIRYDRSGVTDGVTVDLSQKTATGMWDGDSFTHTLKHVENVRGSQTGDDVIKGSGAANRLDGNGGKDVLTGRNGNDTLYGGKGNDALNGGGDDDLLFGGGGLDKFIFKDGSGVDVIGDFGDGNDKVHLKGVTDIVDFSDLQTNHLSEVTDAEGTHSVISYGADDTITLLNVINADLSDSDFIF